MAVIGRAGFQRKVRSSMRQLQNDPWRIISFFQKHLLFPPRLPRPRRPNRHATSRARLKPSGNIGGRRLRAEGATRITIESVPAPIYTLNWVSGFTALADGNARAY